MENKIFLKFHDWCEHKDANGKMIYTYPYSTRCPKCNDENMTTDECGKCGYSAKQLQCPRCKRWMHHSYIDGKPQCDFCDAEDKQIEERKQHEEYVRDALDYENYPDDVKNLAIALKDWLSPFTLDNVCGKNEYIEFLRLIRKAAK